MPAATSAPDQFTAWRDRRLPAVEHIKEGLWSVPVPLGGYGLRYLLAYVLELPDGVAIVDSGWPTDAAWQALSEGMSSIGFPLSSVRALLATHAHSDHYGLAGRVRALSGAWIGLHPADVDITDSQALREWWRGQRARFGVPVPRHLRDAGQPADDERPAPVAPDVLIEDGDLIDLPGWRLRAIWTPGHTPGHLCFHDEDSGLLLSGDHVLPKISPNITVTRSSTRDNPLGDYLASLEKISKIAVTEVLPAHEYRYHGLQERADELIGHHRDRLDEIADLVEADPGRSCWQLTKALSWSRPLTDQPMTLRRMAAMETMAHLVLLRAAGRIVGEGHQPELWSTGAQR